jgi:hypothetical protein
VLGVVEGAVLTILQYVPEERRHETALMFVQLFEDRPRARSVAVGDRT